MATKMTDEAKKRLRELADQQKGRATLKGYDNAGWFPAMDDFQEGRLHFPHESLFTSRGQFDGRDLRLKRFRWTYSKDEVVTAKRTRAATHNMVTFVALKHGRPDQETSLRANFGAFPIVERVFAGPGRGYEARATWVFPAAPVVRFIWALWPGAKEDWGAKAGKYLHGYTAGFFRTHGPKAFRVADVPEGFTDAASAGDHAKEVTRLIKVGILPLKQS